MHSQQLLDYIVKPTLKYMGNRYNSVSSQVLLMGTAAIESNCGYYIKQVKGPALGIWQMEPPTKNDIYNNCDAMRNVVFRNHISKLAGPVTVGKALCLSPAYACAMARLKYAMDPNPLPDHTSIRDIYKYYKRIYNTIHGASTFDKFEKAWFDNNLHELKL